MKTTKRALALLAPALALALAGCTKHDPTCNLGQAPSAPPFPGSIIRCNWNYNSSSDKGLWWIRLADEQYSNVVDIYLPLEAIRDGAVPIVSQASAYADPQKKGFIWMGTNDLSNRWPAYLSDDTSGSVQVKSTGSLPNYTSDGKAQLTVEFDPPLTLKTRDGVATTISGSLAVEAMAGGGCAPCGFLAAELTAACPEGNQFSYNCYCKAAEMHQCTANAPGCLTDEQAGRDEAQRMQTAANDASTSNQHCPFNGQ